MKTIVCSAILLLAAAAPLQAKPPAADPVAITILDRMAENIGALHACSFHLDAVHDALDADAGTIVKRHNAHGVSLVGPDKMAATVVLSLRPLSRARSAWTCRSVTRFPTTA
jgi:hypothetical protein